MPRRRAEAYYTWRPWTQARSLESRESWCVYSAGAYEVNGFSSQKKKKAEWNHKVKEDLEAFSKFEA